MLRIAYIGNFSWPHTTETHIARTLERMRISVLRLQDDRVTPEDIEAAVRQHHVEAVLYTRTWRKGPELTDVWRRLEAEGIVTASYHLDLYFGLRREADMVDDPFWTTQHVFTPDGDPGSAARFEALGINHHWMPPAIVEDEAHLGQYCHRFDNDIVFVGMGARYHEEWPYRQELLAFLKDRYGHRFRRYGPGAEIVRGPHLNDLYATAKVVVGDSLCPGFTHERYFSDRVPETLGRGGYLIMPDVPGLDAHYTPGVHLQIYPFGDWTRLETIIDVSLEQAEVRDTIREAGHRHVLANHTYRNRMEQMLDILGIKTEGTR